MEWALIIIPLILVFVVQGLLQRSYKKYSRIQNSRGLTGYQVARSILDGNGLSNVELYQGEGQLSDYFDPTKQLIKLSPDVYNGTSIASLAVAAHECGHAIQYATHYPVIGFRNKVLPLASTASNLAWIVIIIGIIFSNALLFVGIGLLAIIAIFQILTLPLEFNASSRALRILEEGNYLEYDEVPKARKMLSSAALTYVVALLTTLAQIARLILISNRRN